MKKSSHTNAYLQFLGISRSDADLHGEEPLDTNHKALLETVALHWYQGHPLSVVQTIDQAHLGSPATLHKRLARLIAQDFVTAQAGGVDRRTKWVKPTDKGLDYFHRLGMKMIKALVEENGRYKSEPEHLTDSTS